MALTYEDARQVVLEALRGVWGPTMGTLVVGDGGKQDETDFFVPYGAHEFLVEGNRDFVVMNAPVLFVNKETGAISSFVIFDVFDRLDGMEKV